MGEVRMTKIIIAIEADITCIDKIVILRICTGADTERRRSGAIVDRQFLNLSLLLTRYGRQFQRSELHPHFNTEQCLTARYKRGIGLQRNVSSFDALNNFVIVTLIIDVHLVLVIEGTLRIPVRGHF